MVYFGRKITNNFVKECHPPLNSVKGFKLISGGKFFGDVFRIR